MLTTIFSVLQQFLFVSFIKTQAFKNQLSPQVENELINQYHQGDMQARNKLIEHNLRLVAHIAKKYDGGRDLQEDLISIGTIGLIKAVDSYKPHKSTKLGTYAARCIENEILMHLRTNKKICLDVSLNEVLGVDKDGGEMTLLDILPAEQKDIVNQIQTNQDLNQLQYYFSKLTPREQRILVDRYGLNNHEEKNQKQIAKEMNISRSYVSRLEKRALIKLLKAYLHDDEKRI